MQKYQFWYREKWEPYNIGSLATNYGPDRAVSTVTAATALPVLGESSSATGELTAGHLWLANERGNWLRNLEGRRSSPFPATLLTGGVNHSL